MKQVVAACLLWFATVAVAQAAVTISEVAWMGDTLSANNEWLELHNSGEAVSLAGWTLSDGANLNIALSGTIGSGSYVVLERNRADGQYLHTPPFFIYTGALVNGGATLTLKRADGAIEDQVAGGTDWGSIGGNNETKETAQYTAVGWRTAARTPRAANVSNGTIPGTPATTTTTTTATTVKTTSATSNTTGKKVAVIPSETVRLVLPNVSLLLAPVFQTTTYVNQPVTFSVTPSGLGKTWLDSLVYSWNFGDLATSSEKTPSHRYRYPGTYVVTVHAKYGRHEQIARQEITVLPVALTLARGSGGEILLHNNAPYDVDISGYVLEGVTKQVFPPRSVMAPKSTLAITPKSLLGRYHTTLTLRDTAQAVVAQWPDYVVVPQTTNDATAAAASIRAIMPETSASVMPAIVPVSLATPEVVTAGDFIAPLLPVSIEPVASTTATAMPAYVLQALESQSIPDKPKSVSWPYMALGAVLLMAIAGSLVTRPKMSSSSPEIISER